MSRPIHEALSALREAERELTKQAYQPMLPPPAAPMPPEAGMQPGTPPMGDPTAGAPPVDPAAMPPAPSAAPAVAPPDAGDPQAMMEVVAALESIGQALSSLTSRMAEIEKEQKSMMKDFLRAQGEQKILVQFLRQQAPMGSEVAGVEPPAPMGGVDPAMLESAMASQGAPAGMP